MGYVSDGLSLMSILRLRLRTVPLIAALLLLLAWVTPDAPHVVPRQALAAGTLDIDGDGCAAYEELGPFAARGGQRDPGDFWDFFDTPNPNASPRR